MPVVCTKQYLRTKDLGTDAKFVCFCNDRAKVMKCQCSLAILSILQLLPLKAQLRNFTGRCKEVQVLLEPKIDTRQKVEAWHPHIMAAFSKTTLNQIEPYSNPVQSYKNRQCIQGCMFRFSQWQHLRSINDVLFWCVTNGRHWVRTRSWWCSVPSCTSRSHIAILNHLFMCQFLIYI